MHFKSDKQRKAIFASMNNRFSLTSDGYTTGSGIADAVAGMWPDPPSVRAPPDIGGGAAGGIVGLWPDVGGGRDIGGSAANAIVGLWPGGITKKEDDRFVLYYPTGQFTEQEVLAAREEFDFPRAWVLTNDGKNYKLVLDKGLMDKVYGGQV